MSRRQQMQSPAPRPLGALLAVAALWLTVDARVGAGEPTAAPDFAATAGAFAQKYCIKCHGGAEPKGDLALDRASDVAGKDRLVWEKVVENLELDAMPPDGNELPPPEAVKSIIAWINGQFAEADRNAAPNPGRVTMRRLNRVEYNNTIRDLVGVDFQPGDDFPSDDVGYGFDNIGDVLSISPLLMEKYLAAAERIASLAIVTDRTVHPTTQKVEVERLRRAKRSGDRNAVVLSSVDEVGTKFAITDAGEYVVRVRAYADQAGPEKAKMAIKLAGKELTTVEVAATPDKHETYEVRTKLDAGDQQIDAEFLNDYYEPENPDPANRDRNLYVDFIELDGPYGAAPRALPESHRRILTTAPRKVEGVASRAEWERAAREVLGPFATKAFRRPASREEIDRLVELVQLARSEGDTFEAAIQLAIQAVLVSPHFLFRVELNEPAAVVATAASEGKTEPAIEALSDYQLASRLSYFLWSSMPDEALVAEAAAGTLHDPGRLEAQVRRMLADPKAQALVENFAGQWLQLRNLKTINPDRKRYPDFDEGLRKAMQRETELFFNEIVRQDRSVLDLLDSDFTFVNERLAKHYGIDGIKGDEFQRVAVDRARRGGVLTQASVLTVTSNPTRTSPVKRGKWVLEQIFNSPPPPPPPDVPELADDSGKPLSGTLRERMQQHRANPSCAACHQRMDPIGFGLENFDGIGAFRERDGEQPIDPSGELPDGSKFSGPAELKQIFRAKAPEFRRALAAKMLTYALGRGLEPYDRPALETIAQALEADGDRFSRLVVAVAQSQPFQMRRASPSATELDADAGGDD